MLPTSGRKTLIHVEDEGARSCDIMFLVDVFACSVNGQHGEFLVKLFAESSEGMAGLLVSPGQEEYPPVQRLRVQGCPSCCR